MKIKIITYAKSLISKLKVKTKITTNLRTGNTTHSITPKTRIRRFRTPRLSTSKSVRIGSRGRCTVTNNPRTGTRIKNTYSLCSRGKTGVRVSFSFGSRSLRKPRIRTSGTRIRTPRIKKSYSYRTPRIRVKSGVRRGYSSVRIRSPRVRVRTGSYRVRRRRRY